MSAEGQFLIGLLGATAVREHFPGAGWVGGLTLGADPIAYAIAHRSWMDADPLGGFTIRKQAKDHGTGRRIEGGVPRGARVVVVEDTLTRGGSALQAVEALEAEGIEVLGVLALVDRESGGRERLSDAGHRLVSIFRASELLTAAGHTPTS